MNKENFLKFFFVLTIVITFTFYYQNKQKTPAPITSYPTLLPSTATTTTTTTNKNKYPLYKLSSEKDGQLKFVLAPPPHPFDSDQLSPCKFTGIPKHGKYVKVIDAETNKEIKQDNEQKNSHNLSFIEVIDKKDIYQINIDSNTNIYCKAGSILNLNTNGTITLGGSILGKAIISKNEEEIFFTYIESFNAEKEDYYKLDSMIDKKMKFVKVDTLPFSKNLKKCTDHEKTISLIKDGTNKKDKSEPATKNSSLEYIKVADEFIIYQISLSSVSGEDKNRKEYCQGDSVLTLEGNIVKLGDKKWGNVEISENKRVITAYKSNSSSAKELLYYHLDMTATNNSFKYTKIDNTPSTLPFSMDNLEECDGGGGGGVKSKLPQFIEIGDKTIVRLIYKLDITSKNLSPYCLSFLTFTLDNKGAIYDRTHQLWGNVESDKDQKKLVIFPVKI
ncbi:MAG: hypothetical protein HQK49_10545 [Oligoflexia bacterium]|nr:hypothetical protein [Oligoflexia bacterium]